MKKLSIKIIFVLIGILIIVMGVTRFIGFFILEGIGSAHVQVRPDMIYIPMFILGGIIFIAYAYIINKIVVARIRKLNTAAKKVAKGDFETEIIVKGKDELSDLAASFAKMQAELLANEYLGKEFIRNVSHEFKTPLISVRGYAELINAETDNSNLKEYADIIISETERLSAMIKNITYLSLLDSTTMLKKEQFCPATQVKGILQAMQPQWEAKSLEFDLQLKEFLIINNESLVHQVLQNLISNAIKFSATGGKIMISLDNGFDNMIFEITNGGQSISDEEIDKVFNLFYMSDKSRKTEGSGLGLPLVKKILQKLGGDISLKTNNGAQFKVILPY